jgi:hypothetical protein
MIPPRPGESTASRAELRLFDMLSRLGDDASVALHSLRLPVHARKRSTEADFVIIGPDGVLVLEVKGGRVLRRSGEWVFIDRNDRENISYEGPFAQAEGAMHSLKRRLLDLLGDEALRSVIFGFAVVTPDCAITTSDVEWDEAVYIDGQSVASVAALERGLQRARSHWRDRLDPRGVLLSRDSVAGLVAACRPDFEAVRSLAVAIAGANEEIVRLTERQLAALDHVADWDRVIIEGPAGTGKTVVGVEAARRNSEAGQRTVLTVRSPVLAASLRSALPPEVIVAPHRTLASVSGRVDVLVCDEAQDMMTEPDLVVLDSLLEGGVEAGRWILLTDPAGQRGVLGGFDEDVYSLLKSYAEGRPLGLNQNVRNTRAVVDETKMVTGIKGARSVVESPGRVRAHFVATPEEEAAVVRATVRELRRESVEDSSVTLLTPNGAGKFLDHLSRDFRQSIVTVGVGSAMSWPARGLSLASIPDFKGMENDVVIVCDLWDLDLRRDATVLYTAMTRPRVELHMLWPQSMSTGVEAMKLENIDSWGSEG